jgi:hypothetical protein
MIEYVRQILTSQYDAVLCMLHRCVEACPPAHYEGKIVSGTFRQITYHTLFFVDLYLSPSREEFVPCELSRRGGDEFQPGFSPGLSQEETLAYLAICRQKAGQVMAAETETSLAGPSGFSWYPVSRGELHLVNIRHVQHHTGQLSAYLRRCEPALRDPKALRWVGSGWRL